MIIYKATTASFLDDCFKRSIGEVVLESYKRVAGRRASASEVGSWSASLQQMASTLNDDGIPKDAGIAIEYAIPQSSKRVDFIVSGYNDEKRPSLIIVELKQWSQMLWEFRVE